MADEPSLDDKTLLARLNNLKKSNISLDPSTAHPPTDANDTPKDLVARFQRIQGKKVAGSHEQTSTEVAAKDEDEDHPAPSPTIEELLAELGPEDQWTLDASELNEAHSLLAEAKRALHEEGGTTTIAQERGQQHQTATGAEGSPDEAQNEAAEAAASLQRILDEVGLERQHESAPLDSSASLVFPSAPCTSLSSLDLPSTPTTAPSSRTSKAQAEGFTDEQIDSWCAICCANASVKCFGCDGDLYCWGCWKEGHVGPDVGLEEKTHRWERVKGKRKG